MFIMQGDVTKLVRHIISYIEHDADMQEACISDEHRATMEQRLAERGIDFTSQAIDQTGNEWFDGLEFDSYDKALEVFEAGEEAYMRKKQQAEMSDGLRLRADIDYLAIMAGVEI